MLEELRGGESLREGRLLRPPTLHHPSTLRLPLSVRHFVIKQCLISPEVTSSLNILFVKTNYHLLITVYRQTGRDRAVCVLLSSLLSLCLCMSLSSSYIYVFVSSRCCLMCFLCDCLLLLFFSRLRLISLNF